MAPLEASDLRARTQHGIVRPVDGASRSVEQGRTLDFVGLAETNADRCPHCFSGGQRVRIARVPALNPMLVCDEQVSALHVSVRAKQILNLPNGLPDELATADDLSESQPDPYTRKLQSAVAMAEAREMQNRLWTAEPSG